MPDPLFSVGDTVEARLGEGLRATWQQGVVDSVRTLLGRTSYFVTVGGRQPAEVPERYVRHQRGAANTPPPRPRARRRPPRAPTERGPLRLPEYVAWVKRQPCLWCELAGERSPALVDPHHHGPKATGQTCSDTYVVPACRRHHDAVQQRRIADLPGEWASWLELDHWVRGKQLELIERFTREHGGLS